MQRQIKSSVDSKREALKALFNNEKFGGMMRAAYNSPIGSTDRKRAKQIVSIMKKVGAVNPMMDGQGGPGLPPRQNAPHPITAPAPRDYSSFLVFPSAPPRQPINPGVMDGQGGPGFDSFMKNAYSIPAQTIPEYTPKSNLGAIVSSPWNALAMGTNALSRGAKAATLGTVGAVGNAAIGAGSWLMKDPAAEYNNPTTPPRTPYDPAAGAGMGGALKPGAFASSPPLQTPTTPAPPMTGAPVSNIPWNTLALTTPPGTPTGSIPGTPATPGGTPGAPTTVGSGTDQPVPGGPQTQHAGLAKSASDAVGQGEGAQMFAYRQALRSLPGMTDVPDDKLPYGAMLSGQYDVLRASLWKENDLDNLLEQKKALIGRGVTLEGDLTDFITKRDEFLNETNGMIDHYKDRMTTMDMSDPLNAGQAQSYLDYLYTLRGRQSKRYIDYLDRSVDEYNKQLTAVSTNYGDALQNYRDDLTAKTNLSTQEYQMYFNALSGMYQEISDAPKKAQELSNLIDEGARIRAQTAKDLIAAGNTGVDGLVQKKAYQDYLTWTNPDTKEESVIVDNPEAFFTMVNSNGYDYVRAQENLASTLYLDIKKKTLAGDNAGAISAANKYISMMMDYKGGATNQTDKDYADTVINNLGQGLGSATHSYVSAPDKIADIQAAAIALAKGSAWFSYKPLSRDEFLAKFPNLDKDLLNDMYSIFDASVTRGNDPKSVFPSDPKELATQLSNDIGGMKASVGLTGSGF